MNSSIFVGGHWFSSYPEHIKDFKRQTKCMSISELQSLLAFQINCISTLVDEKNKADKLFLKYTKRDRMYEINMHVKNVERTERMMKEMMQ